jgi:selenocysteine-specific elongation factor
MEADQLQRRGDVFSKAGWKARVSTADERLGERIAELFREAGWTPPRMSEAAARLELPSAKAEAMARRLVEQGVLIEIAPGHCLHQDAVDRARQIIFELFQKTASFTTMEFRDALGVSRKFAVPLLDYFDAKRLTVRSGNKRTPGSEAKEQFRG